MSALNAMERERLLALIADERLGQLAPEDEAELSSLRARGGDGDSMDRALGELLVALDAAGDDDPMPGELRARLLDRGVRIVGSAGGPGGGRLPIRGGRGPMFAAMAAGLLIAGLAVGLAWWTTRSQGAALEAARAQVAALEARATENETVLATARARVEALTLAAAHSDEAIEAQRLELAALAAREVELAERLAAATNDLTAAQIQIARFEAPVDPATLAQDRRKLLEFPGTIRVAWSPFDLPDAPAEQHGVQGDVVWNDELQTGYLRFVGLQRNDPSIEQYQVWVIDERGMEQKVSGGVFNATAEGEVIVPIDPAIDVRRVALFAVTVEEPGGTWVPDLKRRVVVAPRDEG